MKIHLKNTLEKERVRKQGEERSSVYGYVGYVDGLSFDAGLPSTHF